MSNVQATVVHAMPTRSQRCSLVSTLLSDAQHGTYSRLYRCRIFGLEKSRSKVYIEAVKPGKGCRVAARDKMVPLMTTHVPPGSGKEEPGGFLHDEPHKLNSRQMMARLTEGQQGVREGGCFVGGGGEVGGGRDSALGESIPRRYRSKIHGVSDSNPPNDRIDQLTRELSDLTDQGKWEEAIESFEHALGSTASVGGGYGHGISECQQEGTVPASPVVRRTAWNQALRALARGRRRRDALGLLRRMGANTHRNAQPDSLSYSIVLEGISDVTPCSMGNDRNPKRFRTLDGAGSSSRGSSAVVAA